MNIPPIATATAGRFVSLIPFDFNVPPKKNGFYEAVVNDDVQRGDTVVLDATPDGLRLRCRVRTLIAVCEPIEDFEVLEP